MGNLMKFQKLQKPIYKIRKHRIRIVLFSQRRAFNKSLFYDGKYRKPLLIAVEWSGTKLSVWGSLIK